MGRKQHSTSRYSWFIHFTHPITPIFVRAFNSAVFRIIRSEKFRFRAVGLVHSLRTNVCVFHHAVFRILRSGRCDFRTCNLWSIHFAPMSMFFTPQCSLFFFLEDAISGNTTTGPFTSHLCPCFSFHTSVRTEQCSSRRVQRCGAGVPQDFVCDRPA